MSLQLMALQEMRRFIWIDRNIHKKLLCNSKARKQNFLDVLLKKSN